MVFRDDFCLSTRLTITSSQDRWRSLVTGSMSSVINRTCEDNKHSSNDGSQWKPTRCCHGVGRVCVCVCVVWKKCGGKKGVVLFCALSSLSLPPPLFILRLESSSLSPTTTHHAIRQEAICLCGEEEGIAFSRVLWSRHCQRRGIPLRLPNLHYRAMVNIPFEKVYSIGHLYIYSTGYAIAVLLLTLSRCLLGTSSIR